MDERTPEYLTKLASRAVDRFAGRLPSHVSRADAIQDAIVVILEWWDRWNPKVYACEREPFLIMKAWGTLKDKYGCQWKDSYEHPTGSLEEALPCAVGQDPGPEAQDVCLDVRMAVERLPGTYAVVMHLILDGLTQGQVAEQLGVTQPYVSQIVQKAKKKLAKTLEAYK